MNYIDLRSDTVTQPTQEMRDAMYNAPVGDDVYGDDPTVANLEKLAAKVTGKEAALFVASGTMGNQLAVMTHTGRGDEIIISSVGHIVVHEVGAAAVLSGVNVRAIECEGGKLTPAIIEKYIREDDIHMPRTSLVCLDNALANGRVMNLDEMKACYDKAKQYNLPVHLDGARLFNAATALGVEVKDVTQYCDTVMFCLSKGLCAPVGSMLCGSKAFIDIARKNRKLIGGGMRQAGLIAACGIIAIEKMAKRLVDDHNNAKRLAAELAKFDCIEVDMDTVEINMVFFKLNMPKPFLDALPTKMLGSGIKINGVEGGMLRFVTNNDVTNENIDYVLDTLRKLIAQG